MHFSDSQNYVSLVSVTLYFISCVQMLCIKVVKQVVCFFKEENILSQTTLELIIILEFSM